MKGVYGIQLSREGGRLDRPWLTGHLAAEYYQLKLAHSKHSVRTALAYLAVNLIQNGDVRENRCQAAVMTVRSGITHPDQRSIGRGKWSPRHDHCWF